jgi:hypothetical protein
VGTDACASVRDAGLDLMIGERDDFWWRRLREGDHGGASRLGAATGQHNG